MKQKRNYHGKAMTVAIGGIPRVEHNKLIKFKKEVLTPSGLSMGVYMQGVIRAINADPNKFMRFVKKH
jgi:hypothetical protein